MYGIMMKIPKNPAYSGFLPLPRPPRFNLIIGHTRASVNSVQMNIPPINAATELMKSPTIGIFATQLLFTYEVGNP